MSERERERGRGTGEGRREGDRETETETEDVFLVCDCLSCPLGYDFNRFILHSFHGNSLLYVYGTLCR